MITAVDTSVLLDVLGADPRYGTTSRDALRAAGHAGAVVACEVVWAETAGWFAGETGRATVERLRIGFDPMELDAASMAGQAWRRYRAEGGPRKRLIADFLVGAHATVQADRLLTRDRGFFRRYFDDLELMEPMANRG